MQYFELHTIQWKSRYKSDSKIAMCLLLVRLAWPERLFTLTRIFHKNQFWLSSVFNDTVLHLFDRYGEIVAWHSMLNNHAHLRKYSKAISRELNTNQLLFWGFIDGTFRGVARPINEQKEMYSGYKREHGIKFQNIILLDGLLMLQKPYEGKLNDWKMFKQSEVENRIRTIFRDKELFYLYENPAYKATFDVLNPWRGASTLNDDQRNFNKSMTKVRIAVEQRFDLTQKFWSHNSWAVTQQIKLQPVTAYYVVEALLTNCYTCIKGNQIVNQFLIMPSTLHDYLTNEFILIFPPLSEFSLMFRFAAASDPPT